MTTTPTLTPLDRRVAEVLALDEKRTPGEWVAVHNKTWYVRTNDSESKFIAGSSRPNAAFIASAPLLAAELRKHAEMVDRLRELVRDMLPLIPKPHELQPRGWRRNNKEKVYAVIDRADAALTEQENV